MIRFSTRSRDAADTVSAGQLPVSHSMVLSVTANLITLLCVFRSFPCLCTILRIDTLQLSSVPARKRVALRVSREFNETSKALAPATTCLARLCWVQHNSASKYTLPHKCYPSTSSSTASSITLQNLTSPWPRLKTPLQNVVVRRARPRPLRNPRPPLRVCRGVSAPPSRLLDRRARARALPWERKRAPPEQRREERWRASPRSSRKRRRRRTSCVAPTLPCTSRAPRPWALRVSCVSPSRHPDSHALTLKVRLDPLQFTARYVRGVQHELDQASADLCLCAPELEPTTHHPDGV